MNDKILLTNIQRFSFHDGPGIRTTVFLKGCSLRCPWCSNPENLVMEPQPYVKDGMQGVYGKYYSTEELVFECLKDKGFYGGKIEDPALWNITDPKDIENLPGGITFSGGEALLQVEKLVPVIRSLHENNVHVAVETALFVNSQAVQMAIDNIDFFCVDVKVLNLDRCMEIEKGDIELYLRNLESVFNSSKPVVIRIPVIGNYTDDKENRKAVHNLIQKYRPLKIELIKEHNLGESKYKSLNMKMDYHGIEDRFMEAYKSELDDIGIPVEICKI